MQVTRTEAIKRFLAAKTHSDLASMYTPDMEVQVNVAQDGGMRVETETKSRSQIWTDGVQTWAPFRIPYNADSNPNYEDRPMSYNLEAHAEGVGMTGWDWRNKLSRWVAFDFDAIVGHSKNHTQKLTNTELEEIRQAVSSVEWATIRKSTGGNGLHIYVMLDDPVPTNTHTEHAALGRAILGLLAAETGKDLSSKVDAVGQNMWVWHRKMIGTQGLTLIKSGTKLPANKIPMNWKDHIEVVTGARKRIIPDFIKNSVDDAESVFEELSGQRSRVPLDDDHKRLIEHLATLPFNCWFDSDNHMLVTHTYALKKAHEDLNLKGLYSTVSQGSDSTHNCFAYPLKRGAWVVRRFTRGITEAKAWDQDRVGWTRCFYNKEPDLKTAAAHFDGIEHPSGGYVFDNAEAAGLAAATLGLDVKIPNWALNRQTKIKENKDGKVVIEFESIANADTPSDMKGWLQEGKKWKKVYNLAQQNETIGEVEVGNYDDLVRHLIDANDVDAGWVVKSDGIWHDEAIGNVNLFLAALGLGREDIKMVLGSSVIKCWRLVNLPFDTEYPGNRQWNRRSPQFAFPPAQNLDNLSYPTWQAVLNHIGRSLDPYVRANEWARTNDITTGAEYLKLWIASCFQCPKEPLPYLFLYGNQNTGKSILHEALSLLVTRGVSRADNALANSAFNGELEGSVICVVEETDFSSKNKSVYNLIKDWVTARQLPINRKYETPYMIENTTHWMQCSNEISACPIFPGDSRITMIRVDPLQHDEHVPKRILLERLKKEGPDFLAEILNVEIPECNDRLRIPVITTPDKKDIESSNRSPLEVFLEEHCYEVPGKAMLFSTFYEAFAARLEGHEVSLWSRNKVGRELNSVKFPKGRMGGRPERWIGNISFVEPTDEELRAEPLVTLPNGRLVPIGEARGLA